METKPTGERIISILIDLYAKQENLNIKYTITKGEEDNDET